MKLCWAAALSFVGPTIDDFHSKSCPIICEASSKCARYKPSHNTQVETNDCQKKCKEIHNES